MSREDVDGGGRSGASAGGGRQPSGTTGSASAIAGGLVGVAVASGVKLVLSPTVITEAHLEQVAQLSQEPLRL